MGKLGIDFGTSYSTLCVFDENKKTIVPIKEIGSPSDGYKIPSIAYYKSSGNFVYGSAAVEMDPESEGFDDYDDVAACQEAKRLIHQRTVLGIKRKIGKDAVIALPDKDGIKQVSVSEIVTGFFKYFKEQAEKQYFKPAREKLTQVCITYPVDFSPEQVEELRGCAVAAGLPEIMMVEEPVAAALAFSEEFSTKDHGKSILVYDLGGGTFDLAFVHEEQEGIWKVPFKSGDKNCGGNDFDALIYNAVQSRLRIAMKDDGYFISGNAGAVDVDVLSDCRKLKEKLSMPQQDSAKVMSLALASTAGVRYQRIGMERTEFENIIGDRVQHTVDMVVSMSESLHREGYHVGALALIGGSSVIPMIEARLKQKVGFPIMRGFDADIAVARGAIVRLNTYKVESVEIKKKPVVVKVQKIEEKKRPPKGVCPKCKGYFYDGQSFCHECGHLLENMPELSNAASRNQVEERLGRIIRFDKHFDVDPGYGWDVTVAKFAEKIDRLRALFAAPELGFSDQLPNHMLERMERLIEKCRDSEFHIALIGTIKAGKSTLVNAMFGGHYASVSETSETAVLTKFRAAGSGEDARDRIEIKYYTKKEWEGIWRALKDAKRKSPRTEAVDEFITGYTRAGADEIKDRYLSHADICRAYKSDSDLQVDLRKCTSAKSPEHYFVKEVTVYLKRLELPPQVVFVDTPGLNDIFEYRSNITKNYIGRANAVIVCVDARALTKEIHDLILQVFDNAGHDVSKVYIVATHIDDLNQPHEGWERVYGEWKSVLLSKSAYGADEGHCNMLVRENVIPVAAYKILQLLDSSTSESEYKKLSHFAEDFLNYKPEDGHEVLVEKIEKFAKVELLKDRIRSRVISRYESILMEDIRENFGFCAKEVREFLQNLVANNAEVIKTAKLGVNKINERIKELAAKIKKLEDQKEKLKEAKATCVTAIEQAKTMLKNKQK